MNVEQARKIISEIHRIGVREVVLCAGARNSPLIAQISVTTGLRIYSFFEERSAAFFALGIARRSHSPVAVITTSGTAVAELLPAALEAYYSGAALLLITADRPRRLRGSGAPQSIDQTNIFTSCVTWECDLEGSETISLGAWTQRGPAHINICFDEPLIDSAPQTLTLPDLKSASRSKPEPDLDASVCFSLDTPGKAAQQITNFLRKQTPCLVLVSALTSAKDQGAVKHFLEQVRLPTYIEATSGLREKLSECSFVLNSGDKLLSAHIQRKQIARILRIGGVPTTRAWRDVEESIGVLDVLSLSELPFAALSAGTHLHVPIAETLCLVSCNALPPPSKVDLISQDRAASQKLEQLILAEPRAEPAIFRALSRLIPKNALVYVGNSLPIREWELAADRSIARSVYANRGVNGIDGQLSTFLGMAHPGQECWAILGDLTTLYDLAGLWGAQFRKDAQIKIVVINNGGGKIFTPMFNNPIFENQHQLRFDHWAAMWGFDYQMWDGSAPLTLQSGPGVLEIIPDNAATARFSAGLATIKSL